LLSQQEHREEKMSVTKWTGEVYNNGNTSQVKEEEMFFAQDLQN
jgi:hypothetical protein